MTHPITPPPELVQQWVDQLLPQGSMKAFTVAAQWGADQELETCCEWIPDYCPWDADHLRAARRPKPPSLKELALEALEQYTSGAVVLIDGSIDTIRRALEALPDDAALGE